MPSRDRVASKHFWRTCVRALDFRAGGRIKLHFLAVGNPRGSHDARLDLPNEPDSGQIMDTNWERYSPRTWEWALERRRDRRDPLLHGFMSRRCGIGIAQPDWDLIIDHYQLPARGSTVKRFTLPDLVLGVFLMSTTPHFCSRGDRLLWA
jgi:hypothetical protein